MLYNNYEIKNGLPLLYAVEGFNPEDFLDTAYDGAQRKEIKYLPLRFKKIWFRAIHQCGKIATEITEVTDSYVMARCRVYTDCTDTAEQFVAEASSYVLIDKDAIRRLNLVSEELIPFTKLTAIGRAEAKALTNAGFGLGIEEEKDISESLITGNAPDATIGISQEQKTVIDQSLQSVEKQSFSPTPTLPTDETIPVADEGVSPLDKCDLLDSTVKEEKQTTPSGQADSPSAEHSAESTNESTDELISEKNVANPKKIKLTKKEKDSDAEKPVPEAEMPELLPNELTPEKAKLVLYTGEVESMQGKTLGDIYAADPNALMWICTTAETEVEKKAARMICQSDERLAQKLGRIAF